MATLAPEVRARIAARDNDQQRRAENAGDIQWCDVARAEVLMDVDGRCRFCRTDHSFASRLTNREIEGMRMLAAGSTRKEIAHRLEIGQSSVANDWRNVRQKLNAKTTAQALAMLVREGSA